MSDNFIVDPKLFYDAKSNIANVARREDNFLVLVDDLLSSFPPDYIYADKVTDICSSIDAVCPIVNGILKNLISHERMLIEVDDEFREFAKEFATLTAGYLLVSGVGGFSNSLHTFTLSKSGIVPRTIIPNIAELASLINDSND